MDIGIKLKQARQEAGVTQTELAEQLGVHQKDISRWENGERTPALETFAKICRILEVSADDMLEISRQQDT
ncbi:MAG: helix-turn-helix domain-containing protein [Lachnospiraceae bacterium]